MRLSPGLWVVVWMLISAGWVRPASTNRGRPVVSIRLDCDAHLNFVDFLPLVTQKIGEPLDPGEVAQSLKNLYATGRFQELRADSVQKDSGLELVFVGKAVYFVGTVQVEGAPGPFDPRELTATARLRLGQTVSEDELNEAAQRISQLLRENAYYNARIDHVGLRNPETQETAVIFKIRSGRPARLNKVEFTGHLQAPPGRLAGVAHWPPGLPLTALRAQRGLSKIEAFYSKNGYPLATVNIEKRVFDPKAQTEEVQVQVETGPRVHVLVRGASMTSSKLRDLLPIYSERVGDESAVERGQQSLEDYFQRQGYFTAQVQSQRVYDAKSDLLTVTYTVQRNARGEFAGFGFKGNQTLATSELAAIVTPQPTGLLHERKVFSREILDRDVQNLKMLYESRGFPLVRLVPQLDEDYQGVAGSLFVTFQITEGPRTRVRRLLFSGVPAGLEKQLWPLMLTKPGQPYSPANAQTDHDALLTYFANRGFTEATATWHAVPAGTSQEVDVEFGLSPGPQQNVSRVILLGNERTRTRVISRELTIQSGEPLSQSSLLESQRQLYDLGIFNQVRIATQDPEGTETGKTVLVNVEEARRWTLSYGGGVEAQRLGSNQPQGQFKASPRLSMEVSRLNVDGRAQTFALRGRLSNLEKSGAVSYLLPRFLARRDLSLRINGLVDRSRDVLTFTAEREEAAVNLEKRFGPATLLVGRFSYRRVLVDSTTLRISPEEIPIISRPARVGMLSLSYVNDHRDNPSDATEGSYSLVDAGTSWERFGSEANFLRFSGQNSTYYRLGPHIIFARNTRFALVSPFGGLRTIVVTQPGGARQTFLTHEIPLPERLFMGGSEAHRGFSINQAGPRDPVTGFPVGGNALFLNSLELRAPFRENRFGLVFFHDAGNVYSTIRKMRLLDFRQRSPADFDITSHAVGLGMRYRTPVGPLRFDVGYNLNPPRFSVSAPQGPEIRQLSQWQFFLSIGQSF